MPEEAPKLYTKESETESMTHIAGNFYLEKIFAFINMSPTPIGEIFYPANLYFVNNYVKFMVTFTTNLIYRIFPYCIGSWAGWCSCPVKIFS